MNSCGNVGQSEYSFMPAADIRVGQDVDRGVLGDQGVEDVHDGGREPALREAARALHEQDDGVRSDELVDLLLELRVERHGCAMASSTSLRVGAGSGRSPRSTAAAWDGLDHGPSPFLRHGFLRALEDSGSIGGTGRQREGWTPVYLLAEQAGELVGGGRRVRQGPQLRRVHLRLGLGERGAARRHPLLPQARDRRAGDAGDRHAGSCSRPVPAPEVAGRADRPRCAKLADDTECSSIHWLFCTAEEQALLDAAGFFARDDAAVPLEEPRLRDVRRLPRRSSRVASASSCARSAQQAQRRDRRG